MLRACARPTGTGAPCLLQALLSPMEHVTVTGRHLNGRRCPLSGETGTGQDSEGKTVGIPGWVSLGHRGSEFCPKLDYPWVPPKEIPKLPASKSRPKTETPPAAHELLAPFLNQRVSRGPQPHPSSLPASVGALPWPVGAQNRHVATAGHTCSCLCPFPPLPSTSATDSWGYDITMETERDDAVEGR